MPHPAKWVDATPDELVIDVATRSLRGRLKPVQRNLPRAADSAGEETVEFVHQLRVWCRRAQAALEMYRELLPDWRAAWVDKQLKRIRGATNDARDDDVFAMRLLAEDDDPGAAHLLARVQAHRSEAQQKIIRVYQRLERDDCFNRKIAKLLKRVRHRGKHKGKKLKFAKWAKSRFRPVVTEFLEAAGEDLAANEKLHRFRIEGKKLRYAMELLWAAFPDEMRTEVYPMLADLQEKLGQINDHATAIARVQHWIDDDDQPKERDYLQHILSFEKEQLKDKRAAFFEWWTVEREETMTAAFDRVLDLNWKKQARLK